MYHSIQMDFNLNMRKLSSIYIKGRGNAGDCEHFRALPSYVVRKQLNNIKQDQDESLEHFAYKIHEMSIVSYRDLSEDDRQFVAVQTFLRGCNNTQAAFNVMDKDPPTLEDALEFLKNEISSQLIESRMSALEAKVEKLEKDNIEIKSKLKEIIQLLKHRSHPQDSHPSDSPPVIRNDLNESPPIKTLASVRPCTLNW